jgi:hypothetical protein
MPRQLPGAPDGYNPLIYTGSEPNLVTMTRRPNAGDYQGYELGYWWIIPTQDSGPSEEVWILISKRNNIATWKRVDGAFTGLESLTGDTGGQVEGDAGNINVVGGTGITVAGNPATHTLTIDATNAGGFNSINRIYKTTLGAGVYTVPANLVQAEVEVMGGGGGAAGGGAGGAGAGYAKRLYTKAQLGGSGAPVDYFVGNGGANGSPIAATGEDSTFGTGGILITGGGGSGGNSNAGVNVLGGSGSGGDFNLTGGNGVSGYYWANVEQTEATHYGGGSFFASPLYSPGINGVGGANGLNGNLYGGGGTPGSMFDLSGSGGNGGQGIVIITEYLG